MKGLLVPLVMIPRFTGFVVEGTYTTAPLEVAAYEGAVLAFWRGPVLGVADGADFDAYFEESHDAQTWTQCTLTTGSQPVTTGDAEDLFRVQLKKRWFRTRIVLANGTTPLAGVTCWAAGSLVRRIPE